MKKLTAVLILAFLAIADFYGAISFENPQINSESKILYSVKHEIGGTENYKTLFLTDATQSETTKILTCFPEKLEVLSNGAMLQIRNRYGTARYSVADSTLTWIHREKGIPTEANTMVPQSVSPDGKWLCYLKKISPANGKLILKNASTSQEYVLSEKTDFDYSKIPAKWCPDKELLLYENKGSVYFCDPKAMEQNLQLSEEFRKIGEGSINCIEWANSKYIVYVDRDLIYKIATNELYTRALYSNVVGTGVVVGRLPMGFDKLRDRFWVNSSVNQLVTIKSNSIISSYKINGTSSSYFTDVYSKPFSDIHGSVVDYNLFWAADGSQILWVNLMGLTDGKKKSSIYRLSNYLELVGTVDDAGKPVISPDRKKIAFGTKTGLFVYNLSDWALLGTLGGQKFVSYAWSGNTCIYAGGNASVREWKMSAPGKFNEFARLLFLSAVKTAFWKPNAENIVCAQSSTNDAIFYDYDQFRNIWCESIDDTRTSFEFMRKAAVQVQAIQNAKYRVYTGNTDNLLFNNAIYIRSLQGNGKTTPVFEDTVRTTPARRQIALVFDAMDCADGVTKVLSVLNDYGIKATFFFNGEFIRRYPKETRQINSFGHDCGSMYFTITDFTEKGFVIDEEFIRRGLARNEDEFFAATGNELMLMWHAPFYKSTEKIRDAAAQSGYKYIECGRLSLDTLTQQQVYEQGKNWYLSSKDLIELYAETVEDCTIIPVSLGIASGTRKDYLYDQLSLLIGNMLEQGYEFKLVRDLR
ncbi:MAG: polysaccharide deacetylase family protein [Treponema sp.]|nr:polysaccharide deacetylase family protein [Candidatus Treponema equifaecale]